MKRIGVGILLLVACTCLQGCGPLVQVVDSVYGEKEAAKIEAVPHIGFSNGELLKEKMEVLLTEEEFQQETLTYPSYRESFFYDTLKEEEQKVYRILEYAMEHQYTNIFIDDLLFADPTSFGKILTYLALDSPLLEQNLHYGVGKFDTTYTVEFLELYDRQVKFDGYYIKVDNFAKEFWEKKLVALEEAEQIVSELPANLTKQQTAERLYQYVAEHISYIKYDDLNTVRPYLYDALIEKKTHCDGFANALSLLFHVADIPCIEKIYQPGEGGVGHTWNSFCLDNKWYNMDGTGAKSILGGNKTLGVNLYFAYPDELQTYTPNYAEIYPACETGLEAQIDYRTETVSAAAFADQVVKAYKKQERCLALINVCEETQLETQMQEIANRLQRTISWVHYPVKDGKTVLYIY